jgi:hypothetical protein
MKSNLLNEKTSGGNFGKWADSQQLVSNSRELGLMDKWFCIWEISANPKIIALFSPTIAY